MKKRSRKKARKATRSNPQSPDLKFGPGDVAGFTPAGLAGFHDLNPATVVRELLQNSLDAAREAGRDIAIIRFEVEEHKIDSIPGIGPYRSALERAIRDQKELSHGRLPGPAAEVVQAMEGCLKSGECETLFVLDNGIGLDESRMQGLLADGLSVKSDAGTGALGNGHMTVVPASDLRYVLYGGRTEKGEIIGAGHAVLASHQQADECKSKDGYYVKDIKSHLFEPYVFPENDEVPAYIKAKLEWIAETWEPGAGAVVAVPGFNHFRAEEESLWDMVSKAAACSFFAAFAKGELRVELKKAAMGNEECLDKSNIASTLEKFSAERRTRSGFLNGSRALAAFETIEQGKEISVNTGIGQISMRWRELPQGGLSRVDLCRNGMWVTDDLPRLGRYRFADFKPFHCVILLDADDGEIYRLVRNAEGPLHNNLEVKRISHKEEKTALNKAMAAVFSKLKEVVPKHDAEEFEIEDVMAIDSSGIASGGRRPGMAGRFREMRRRPRFPKETGGEEEREVGPGSGDAPESEGKGGGVNRNRRGRGTFRRSGNAIPFSALPVPTGKRSCRVDLLPGEKAIGSEARFALDESLDESCDAFRSEEFVELKNVKIDGSPAPENMLTYDEKGSVLGVRLGALDPEKTIQIEFDYEPPASFHLSDDMPVVLNTQLIRRAARSDKQESS